MVKSGWDQVNCWLLNSYSRPVITRIIDDSGIKAIYQRSSDWWIFSCVWVTFGQVTVRLQRCSWTWWSGSFPHQISSFISALLSCFALLEESLCSCLTGWMCLSHSAAFGWLCPARCLSLSSWLSCSHHKYVCFSVLKCFQRGCQFKMCGQITE